MNELADVVNIENDQRSPGVPGRSAEELHRYVTAVLQREPRNAGELFEGLHESLGRTMLMMGRNRAVDSLISCGLVKVDGKRTRGVNSVYSLTDSGRRFKNRMLLYGDHEKRMKELWASGGDSGIGDGA